MEQISDRPYSPLREATTNLPPIVFAGSLLGVLGGVVLLGLAFYVPGLAVKTTCAGFGAFSATAAWIARCYYSTPDECEHPVSAHYRSRSKSAAR